MKATDAEIAIAVNWSKSEREFASAVEQLIQSLLQMFEVEREPFSRCTDGMLPAYEEKTSETYFATAVIIFLPDQSVEPVSVDLSFDAKVEKLRSSNIRYGWANKRAFCGDTCHRKMSASLASMPKLERNWLWHFSLEQGKWTAQKLAKARDPLLWPSVDHS